jgi:hypothetical protein
MRFDRSVLKGVGVGALTGICVGVGGFFLSETPRTAGMGVAMFWVTPFLAGFAIALVTHKPSTMQAAMWLAIAGSLVFLVGTGREGVLCAVLAFPVLAVGLVLGCLVGNVFRRRVLHRLRHSGGTTVLLLVTPAIILVSHRAELPSFAEARREVVSNSVLIQAPPEAVWAHIQSIDSINVPKPWLMYVGLPIPVRCTLERAGAGAKRTCYFNNGFIQETITDWSPPYHMGLSIDRTNMPGRHWLGFESAVYELHQEGNATRLTRTTTITSHLRPVWYWRYFERLGVASEHQYILNDLAQRMERLQPSTTASGSTQ